MNITLKYTSEKYPDVQIETQASSSDDLLEELLDSLSATELPETLDEFELQLSEVDGVDGYEYIKQEFTSTDDIDSQLDMMNQINYSRDTELADKLDHLLEHYCSDIDSALYSLDSLYIHRNTSIEDLAKEYISSCYNLEDMLGNLAQYFDYKSFGEDLMSEGNYIEVDRDIYEYRG